MVDVNYGMGTPICWADATDYSDTNSGIARTNQIDLTSLADGAGRQGDKVDLGENRSKAYAVKVCLEFDSAPTAGASTQISWSSSAVAASGTGNDGGVAASGADGPWSPGGDAEADREEYANHLTTMGVFPAAADAAPTHQVATINEYFVPPTRYGFPIAFNQAGVALEGDAVEMYVALIPIDEVIG
jgi:hypothetical protein